MESYECRTPVQMSQSEIIKRHDEKPERFQSPEADSTEEISESEELSKQRYQGYKPKIIMFKKKKGKLVVIFCSL